MDDNGAAQDTASATDAPDAATVRAFVKALKSGDTAAVIKTLDFSASLLEHHMMWQNTPLVLACHYGHAPTALALLDRGASPAAINDKGCTALLYACVESMGEVVDRLLQHATTELSPPAAPVYSRLTDETAPRTPLLASAENGFTAGVEKLLARGVVADARSLVLAASRGHSAVCACLLGPLTIATDPDTAEALREALAAAAAHGHESTVRVLCAQPTVLAAAASTAAAPLDAVRAACMLRGADAPASGEASGLRERIVELLLDGGLPTDTADAHGNTPLHLAAGKGLSTVVHMLLAGANQATFMNKSMIKPERLYLPHTQIQKVLFNARPYWLYLFKEPREY